MCSRKASQACSKHPQNNTETKKTKDGNESKKYGNSRSKLQGVLTEYSPIIISLYVQEDKVDEKGFESAQQDER